MKSWGGRQLLSSSGHLALSRHKEIHTNNAMKCQVDDCLVPTGKGNTITPIHNMLFNATLQQYVDVSSAMFLPQDKRTLP